ncbi:hypothetical protein BK816_07680 [Boudabousia tangfeifanii]|uniref:Cation/H+ exchanger transmembrane domain-containing protein n=1 Tax=Boudabousia tangfeifanii TaxID=1912795 RepID=A0A1D9MLX7_9ACTO|nr:sodium:proton antiporter [Boudabousia tangfeifanii]AOZ73189.1 hypothetical protein BK816_07680 [Boudabousia tangfeifanii]
MDGLIVVGIVALLVIVASEHLGERTGVVAPLTLLFLGVAVGLIPQIPNVTLSPEIILELILPPLLFASAVAMPVMDFRRNLGPISTLSVVLVIATAGVLGWFFHSLVPGLSLAGGIALGAIISPTDAVATSIIKSKGVSHRLVTVLEGEGLINDASALVILRSAIAASAAGTVSFVMVGLDFLWAVLGALVIGWIVGEISIRIRSKVTVSSADTVLSLTVPFIAAIPAEYLGSSGLVSAVVAGLITGHHGARLIPPDHRLTTKQTWSVVSLVLEGSVFMIMGIQIGALLDDLRADTLTFSHALWMALLAIVITLLMRTLLVMPLLALGRHRIREKPKDTPKTRLSINDRQRRIDAKGVKLSKRQAANCQNTTGLQRRIDRAVADLRYYQEAKLTNRDGIVMIWAGMRGGVTLAAAQTLPYNTPHRAFLLVTAFLVASISLTIQGGTLGWLIKKVKPTPQTPPSRADRTRLIRVMVRAFESVPVPPKLRAALGKEENEMLADARGGALALATRLFDALSEEMVNEMRPNETFVGISLSTDLNKPKIDREIAALAVQYALDVADAQRCALIAARDSGNIDSTLLSAALANLDADQINLELHLHPDHH